MSHQHEQSVAGLAFRSSYGMTARSLFQGRRDDMQQLTSLWSGDSRWAQKQFRCSRVQIDELPHFDSVDAAPADILEWHPFGIFKQQNFRQSTGSVERASHLRDAIAASCRNAGGNGKDGGAPGSRQFHTAVCQQIVKTI